MREKKRKRKISLEDLTEFLKTLTNKELETLHDSLRKDSNLLQNTIGYRKLVENEYILSKIEEELQIIHLHEAGLQAWNAGQLLKGTPTRMFIDGVEVGDIIGDIEVQERGAEPEYKEVDITKELPEFPKLQRFKKDLL